MATRQRPRNPYRTGRDLAITEQPEQPATRIVSDLADRSGVEAGVRDAIANSYVGQWMWRRAIPHVRVALKLTRKRCGADHPRTTDVLSLLGRSLAFVVDPESVAIQGEALAIRRQWFGSEHALVAESHASVGFALWKTQPIRSYRETLAIY